MIKLFILTATSIIWILSTSNFADAEDVGIQRSLKSQFKLNTNSQNSPEKNSITATEVKSIEGAVIEHYKKINVGPSYPATNGIATFWEVKKIKLTSFSIFGGDKGANLDMARVEIIVDERYYNFQNRNSVPTATRTGSWKYEYNFAPTSINPIKSSKTALILSKRNGKWTAE